MSEGESQGPRNDSPLSNHPEISGQERYVIPATPHTKSELVDTLHDLLKGKGGQTSAGFKLGEDKKFGFMTFLQGQRPDNAIATLSTSTKDGDDLNDYTYTIRVGDDDELTIVKKTHTPGLKPVETLKLGDTKGNRAALERIAVARADFGSYMYDDGLGPPSEGEIADIIEDLKSEDLKTMSGDPARG